MTDVNQVNKEGKSNVEQVRVRGKNSFDVVNQIVETYNASEGWAVKKVNMQMVNNLEVFLERNVEQSDSKTTAKATDDAKVKEEAIEDSKAPQKSDEDSKAIASTTANSTAKTSTRRTKAK